MTGRKKKDNIHPSSESLKATPSGSKRLKQQFKPGDTTWIKIHDNSWWPAQVVGEKTVGNKPKKKAKDEILVRQYGTYEYLYVDPLKSGSEFDHFLKQEDCNAREAFQKSLEDLLRMKSAGKSKRKISKENSTVEAPKGKKQKQDKTQRSREAVGLASLGAPSDKSKEVRGERDKNKSGNESQSDGKINQDNVRKSNIAKKDRVAASKMKVAKQYYLRQPKCNNVGKAVKENVKGKAFKDKGEEQGKVRKKNMMGKEKSGTFEIKNTNQDSSRQMKLKDVKDLVTLVVRGESSKDKRMERRKRGWQDVSQKSVSGGSKVKMMKQYCLRELKHKYDKEERIEKDGDKISKHNKMKQGAEGRSNVKEKATDRVSEVKNVKQNGTRLPKHDDVEEHNIESPGSTKHGTPKETGDLSARRTRVMQSLGLIAPLGSPFRRNGLVEAAVLKL